MPKKKRKRTVRTPRFIELEEAESITRRAIRKRAQSQIKNLIIESSIMKKREGLPMYDVRGIVDIIVKPRDLAAFPPVFREKVERRYFTVRIDAKTGELLGCEM